MAGTVVSIRDAEDRKAAAKQALEAFCTQDHVEMWARAHRHLHAFSLGNQLLILLQVEEGERIDIVKAAWRWKLDGYHPRKGARAIYVWTPWTAAKGKDGSWQCGCGAVATGARCPQGHKRKTVFVLKPVFTASQVVSFEDGSPPPPPPVPAPLEGDSHDHVLQALLDSRLLGETDTVSKVVFATKDDDAELRSAHGYYRLSDRSIVIRKAAPNQMLHVLIHELCHALTHQPGEETADYSYDEEEVVVEAAAMFACAAVGLEVGDTAAPYIANWGGRDGESPHEKVKRHMKVIDDMARRVEQACATSKETTDAED